ncbi:MAG: oligosaccharide flippase family protein, partial [Thiohalomonadales bacterium]
FYQGVFLFFMVASVLFSVLFPKLYRQSADKQMLQNMYTKLLRFLNVLSVCVTPIAIINSELIIRRLLGEQYASEHELFQVLVLLSTLSFATISLNFLNVVDCIRHRIRIELSLHVMVVFIGAYAVTQFAVIGMAVVAVSSYFIAGSIAMFVLYKAEVINIQVISRDFAKLLIVIMISSGIFYFDFTYWWLQAILYIVFILLLLNVFRYWHTEDKVLFEKVYSSIFRKRVDEM